MVTEINGLTVFNGTHQNQTVDDAIEAYIAPNGQNFTWGSVDSTEMYNGKIKDISEQLIEEAGHSLPTEEGKLYDNMTEPAELQETKVLNKTYCMNSVKDTTMPDRNDVK